MYNINIKDRIIMLTCYYYITVSLFRVLFQNEHRFHLKLIEEINK